MLNQFNSIIFVFTVVWCVHTKGIRDKKKRNGTKPSINQDNISVSTQLTCKTGLVLEAGFMRSASY